MARFNRTVGILSKEKSIEGYKKIQERNAKRRASYRKARAKATAGGYGG